MSKYRVQGEYTYTVYKVVEADSEEEAMLKAQDSEPLCCWDSIEQDSYFEYVECATKEVA
jgi:hypothetical protein|tara:strand:+ start:333 stop:512 length:180 start_codon:yes stop_codon:yes gene_type:complete